MSNEIPGSERLRLLAYDMHYQASSVYNKSNGQISWSDYVGHCEVHGIDPYSETTQRVLAARGFRYIFSLGKPGYWEERTED